MLLIAAIALAAIWGTAVAIVLALCVTAARGDRELLDSRDVPRTTRAAVNPLFRLLPR